MHRSETINIRLLLAATIILIALSSHLQAQERSAWMKQARWGVMTHFLADWRARVDKESMNVEKWNELIDHFDVDSLSRQLASVGAGYYLLTIGQNSGYYLAPNATFDRFVGLKPSKCSGRDLVADMYDALNKKGIKLMVYLPSGAPAGDSIARRGLEWQNGPHPNREFQIKWEQVIREWSERWGKKIAGWWFDGCYWPNTMYRSIDPPNFSSFAAAARAGNPQCLVAFNPGVVYRSLSLTPYEDYTAGEIDQPDRISIKRAIDGRIDGAQIHILSFLGETWGMGSPRFTVEQVVGWNNKVAAEGGVITWDVPLQRNGLISQPFIEQLTAIGAAFQKSTAPALSDTAKQIISSPPRRGTSGGVPTARLEYAPGQQPKFWSLATAESIMERYPDYRRAYWKDWTYVQGYMFCGFEILYRSTGDRKYLEYIQRYIDQFVDEKGNFHGDNLTNLDNLMTGTSIVAMYEYTRDQRYKTAAMQFRRAFDDYPRSDGQFWHGNKSPNMWIDGVFMGQMFLLRFGKSIGESEYCFDEVAGQITVFAKHCRKDHTGLYLHAWTDQPDKSRWADPKTGLSPEVWSEGLGWYALILAEALAVLPKEHPKRVEVEGIYRRLAAGLRRTQDLISGGWFMIVDKGDQSGNWIDPSGTAMFVYSIQKGIDMGLLNREDYGLVAVRGYKSLLKFALINDRGLVDIEGAGDGITIKNDFATYVNVPRVINAKEAVGGFLWATALMEKAALEKQKRN